MEKNRSFHPVNLRRTILKMAMAGSTVHIGCAFSIVEILSVLYRNYLRYPHNDPNSPDRDYFVLSKGHGVMAQYACMYELNWLNNSNIDGYFSDGSELYGLSDSRVAGLEVTSGSLGHGVSVGVGLAIGCKRKGTNQKTYILVGDGELNEGAIWEGMMVASHHKLDNMMLIVDANGFQAMGPTKDILSLESLVNKFESFGFVVQEVDGHNECALDTAIADLWARSTAKPRALLARTVKGKGVPFMENRNEWHYTRLDINKYNEAIEALSFNGD